MKKILSVLLSLALVVSLLPVMAFATPSAATSMVVTPPANRTLTTLQVGDTVSVTVSNDSFTSDVYGFRVYFDKTKFTFDSYAGTNTAKPNQIPMHNETDDEDTKAGSISTATAANNNGYFSALWDLNHDATYSAGTIITLNFTVTAVGSGNFRLYEDKHVLAGESFAGDVTTTAVAVVKTPMTAATVTIPAPVKGTAFPATATAGDTAYSVESLTWYTDAGCTTPAPATAASSTDYWAKAVIAPDTANSESFDATVGVTVNSNAPVNVARNSEGKLEVVEKFTTPARVLQSIAVTTQPTNKTYELGDAFNTAGMVVTASYDEGADTAVTGYTCTPASFSTIGSATVEVSYTEGGVTKTDTVTGITVNPKSLATATITLGTALTYNGSEQTQTVASVVLGGATLTAGTDYTVSGNTGTNAGDYTLTITGTGNYTGTATKSFTIAKKTIDLSQYTWNYSGALTYSGSAQTVALASTNPDANYVSPVYGGTYTETNVGSYVATATVPSENVNSNYQTTGEIPNLNWTISAASNPATLSSTAQTVVRNHTLDLATLVSGAVEGTSYQFTIASGDAGAISGTVFTADATKTGAVTVNAKALALNKGGTDAPEYNEKDLGAIAITVIAKPEKNEKVTVSMADWTYGNPATPSASADSAISTATGPTYEYTGTGSTVYGPTPTRPEDIGTYQVKAYYETDEFLYYGTATFTVSAKDISGSTVAVATIADQEYTGAAIIPEVTVTDSQTGKTLVKDTDYNVSGTSTNVGSATVVITGKGNYSGTRNENFTIVAKKLAKPTANTATFTYNGAEQTYTPVGFDANTMLISGNVQKNAGTYTVPVGLKDSTNYQWATSGDPEFTFTIAPKSLTYTATVADKTYDGTDKATVTDLALVGVEGSDVVTLTKDGATATLTGSIDAGANRPVKVVLTNPGLAGADNANYVLDSAFVYEGAITINPLTDTSAAPVAEESTGTIVSNQAPVADKKSVTYNVTVTPDGSNTTGLVKMVMPLPAGTTAGYTFKVSFNGTSYNATVTSSGLVVELPAGSGEAIVTWTAPATSNDGGMFIINGNGIATPVSTTGSTGAMSVPTSLTGTIKKVTVDGKTVSSKNYTVTGNTVVLSEAFMKTLSNGKHTVKISDATNTYTVTVNVNKAGVKSATTGDAGIALYAVMALSSAAGAVWVTRKNKKED